MKKIISLIIAAVALAACSVKAQSVGYQSLGSVPTVAAGATSNSVNLVIGSIKQQNVALGLVTTGTNVVWRFSGTVDNVNYQTNYYVITQTSSPLVTNLNVAGVVSLRLDSVASVGTTIATNSAAYGIKIGCP